MRLFVGLKPSDECRKALSDVQENLRAAGVTARFYEPSNLHMTLAFIGEWPENISAILPRVEQPFSVILSKTGVFPKARVLWAGAEHSQALDRLAQRVRENLAEQGIPFDPKPFVPHVTLGRKPFIPEGMDLAGIEIPSVAMLVTDVYLYRSEKGEKGMVYTVIGKV